MNNNKIHIAFFNALQNSAKIKKFGADKQMFGGIIHLFAAIQQVFSGSKHLLGARKHLYHLTIQVFIVSKQVFGGKKHLFIATKHRLFSSLIRLKSLYYTDFRFKFYF